MDTRISGWKCLAALTVCLAFGLAGCNPVYTVHSIAAPGDEPSTIPDISGLWESRVAGWRNEVMRVTELDYDVGQCRDATIQSLGNVPFDDEMVADEICFIPVAGHVIVQLRTAGTVQLYQQYLARFDQESISLCATVWSDLVDWSDKNLGATAAHGLQFTRRGGGDSTQLLVISPRSELLSYLEGRLAEAVKACDKLDKDGRDGWLTYVRLTLPRVPDVAGAIDDLP